MTRTTQGRRISPLVAALIVITSLLVVGTVASRRARSRKTAGAAREALRATEDGAPAAVQLPSRPTRAPKSRSRGLVGSLTFVVGAVIISMLATSGSYALWNGKTVLNASSLATGSIGLTINDGSSYTLPFSTATLAPGKSVFAAATYKNTGTVPLSVVATSTTVSANTNGLASSLTLVATGVSTTGACAAGLSGGTSAALGSFNTNSAPYSIAVGASKVVCYELKLDSAAPSSAQGGSTTFKVNITANQVRP